MTHTDIHHLLILARRYSSEKALSLITVSLCLAGQGRLMERLGSGCGITVRRRNKILQWFSDRWLAGLLWSEEITRPSRLLQTIREFFVSQYHNSNSAVALTAEKGFTNA